MSTLREMAMRVAGLVRSLSGRGDAEADADLRAEMEAHVEMQAAEYMRRGMNAHDARRQALLDAGGFTNAVESVREQRSLPAVEHIARDMHHALRTLTKQRGFSVAVLLTLGLGIAATVTMFSILNAVILRPLPYPEPDRIVSLSLKNKEGDMSVVDDRSFESWRQSAKSLSAMAAFGSASGVMQTSLGPQEIDGLRATASYFDVLGVKPLHGRLFTADEEKRGSPSVVLISEQLWRSSYAADPRIIGKSIVIDGSPFSVIGIMPASFTSPSRAQFWQPYLLGQPSDEFTYYLQVVARMRADATIASVQSELEAIQRRLDPSRREAFRGLSPITMTLHERRYGDVRSALVLLFAAVGVLLLITCANLANLSLARAINRQREFALRLALGASRWRIVRYVMTESSLLAAGGAALGLLIAASSIGYFVRLSPAAVANADGVRIDSSVLAFTLVITIVTTILFGLVPALTAGRSNINLAIAGAGHRTTGNRGQRAFRRSLVVLELATALVLLVGAGLVARTFWTVASTSAGFQAKHVLTATVSLPWNSYTDTTAHVFMDQLLERVRNEPGVESAALADALPLSGSRMSVTTKWQGKNTPRFEMVGVTPQYFETIGNRVLEGRAINNDDRENGAPVVMLSASLARYLFPNRSAVGQILPLRQQQLQIIGVTEDIRQRGLEGEVSKVAFVPMTQSGGWRYMHLALKTERSDVSIAKAIARNVQQLDPLVAPPKVRTLNQIVEETVAPRKFVFVLLGIFAGLAATLAVIGLYGVLSYVVAEQTREIGIRVALGANRRNVMSFVLGQGATLTFVGVAGGLVTAFLSAHVMEKLVYSIGVHDTQTFVSGTLLLTVVSLLASYIPARRASKVDPMEALRTE